jgi:hypothetical protein
VLQVLADIRAVPLADLTAETDLHAVGTLMVTSLEVVAILVVLQDETGLDPADPSVLRGCDAQSVEHLVAFIIRKGGRT